MAGGSSNTREQNFWPGFVDALTNVVLVMVFVVVVFAVTMFGTMMKLARTQIARSVQSQTQEQAFRAQQREAHMAAQAEAERRRADRLQEENRQLANQLRAAQARAAAASGQAAAPRRGGSEQAPVTVTGRAPAIVVSFASGVTSMEKKLVDAFDAAVGGYAGAAGWKVRLEARMSEASPSEARRLAFYRLAWLRDHLVARGVPAGRIETLIVDARSTDGRSPVAVRIDPAP